MKRNAPRCPTAASGLFVLFQVGLGGCASERFGLSPDPLADAGAAAISVSTTAEDAGSSPLQSAADARPPSASEAESTEAGPGGDGKRGPTAPTAGSQYPFPQNRQSSACTYPSNYSNADVQAAYAQWKKDLVTADGADGHLRVQRTPSDGIDACRPLGSTVSEGIAYGMLASVYMNDPALFDGLWLFEQGHVDSNGLMNWAPEGSGPDCGGAATDADEDMAFALVMADRQWGGQGSIGQPYKQAAITMIGQIWNTEVFQSKWLRAGDGDWATNTNLNVSYLSPAYYKVFRNIDPNTSHDWNALVDGSYSTIADALTGNQNQSNGLVPAWCDDSSQTTCRPGSPGNYQYDSCRTPFRIGLDWCWSSDPRAQAYVQKTSTFFAGVGASHIADGYALDGTPMPAHVGQLAAAFVGPAAVGAMSAPAYQGFLDDAYAEVATGNLGAGGAYYEESWTLLSLLMLTGNFVDYSSL